MKAMFKIDRSKNEGMGYAVFKVINIWRDTTNTSKTPSFTN